MDTKHSNLEKEQNPYKITPQIELKEEIQIKFKKDIKASQDGQLFLQKRIKITKMYIYLIFSISLLSFKNTRVETISGSSSISLRFNKTGDHGILYTAFYKEPDRIYINEVVATYTNIQTISDVSDIVKLEWDEKLTSCQEMFRDIQELIVVDLSNFDSSLVTDTSNMFQNCGTLTSINFDGFSTTSLNKMNHMFYQAYNLRSLDLSHFDTSKVTTMMDYSCNV